MKYNGIFYIARIDAGTFSGVVPTNTSKWNPFGAQFESVATQLLLAENANIGGLIFKNERLISQRGYVGSSESNDYSNENFVPNILIDGKNGAMYLNGFFASKFSTSLELEENGYPRTMNFIITTGTSLNFTLPDKEMYIGSIMTIYLDRDLEPGESVRIGDVVSGGFTSFMGDGIVLIARYKGTIIRIMAKGFEDGHIKWELINYNDRSFSTVDLAGNRFVIDRSKFSFDRSVSDMQQLWDYWSSI